MSLGGRVRPDRLSDVDLLVQEGIEAAWAGDHARARDLLSLAVSLDAGNVRGWLWLSGEVDGAAGQEHCLRRALALDPGNEVARRELERVRTQARLRDGGRDGTAGQWAGLAETAEPGPAAGDRPGFIVETAGPAAAVVETVSPPVAGTQGRAARELPAGLRVRSEFALIALLGLALLALIALGVEGLPAPLPLLRLFLGLAFVLFVPGYALQAALFPRAADLDGPERLALSLGLSVAVVPVLALILDRLPWGIRLWPIVVGEALVIAILSAVAVIRRHRLPAGERPVLAVRLDARGWWAAQDRGGRILYGVLAGALLLAAVSAAAVILAPKPGERFTEFYVLGPEGLAENYPRRAAPGQALAVTAGIANREGVAAEYRVEVRAAGETVGGAGPVALQDGEVWEAPLAYALPRSGDDQQVEFLLYRDGGAGPYRRLRLWIDVVAGGRP